MSLWLPSSEKVYFPPAKPVARVYSTDEFVKPTSVYFHAGSDRLLTVGHPYFNIYDTADTSKVVVPKVSGNQFRAFRLVLPDPNKFALIDKNIHNPDRERLVWRLRGVEISRGGPLGIGTTGHPFLNKLKDTENPNQYFTTGQKDARQNVSTDPKQTQLFVVGCVPCTGSHWDAAKPCADPAPTRGDCPPIELVNTVIQDGDMCDIGFGNMNFRALQDDRAGVPLDITSSTCKWPDFTKMTKDVYGNGVFFFGRREQLFARHFYCRNGVMGEKVPDQLVDKDNSYYYPGEQERSTMSSHVYFGTPSGSLVASDSNIFNRPYWLHRAQGMNNGVCWGNQLFVTMVDNTRNTNFNINVSTEESPLEKYDATKFKHYVRHTEEYEFELILQLCTVPLEPDILAHLNVMDSNILDDWNLAFVPPPSTGLEDQYRYLKSLATRCPDQTPSKAKEDPYGQYSFWKVDLTERLSSDLSQHSLGRRFLYQSGLLTSPLKRSRTSTTSASTASSKTKKRRRG